MKNKSLQFLMLLLAIVLLMNSSCISYADSIQYKGVIASGVMWYMLYEIFGNEYATAGVMANILAESGIQSNNLENSANTRYGITDEEYTTQLNNGGEIYSQYGYGLCMWSGPRHINLVNFMKGNGYDVSDARGQLRFLIYEFDETTDGIYNSSWYPNLAGSMLMDLFTNESTLLAVGRACSAGEGVTDEDLLKCIGASEIWLHGYEKPVNETSNVEPRANIAMDYYETFAGTSGQHGGSIFNTGDINKDDNINIIDVKLLLQKVIVGVSNPSKVELTACDMNMDDEINIIDVKLLLQKVISET